MRLPWRKARACPAPVADKPRAGMADALAAVHASRAAVGEARSRSAQVAVVVARLGSLKQENHISDRFEQAVRDGFRWGGHAGGD